MMHDACHAVPCSCALHSVFYSCDWCETDSNRIYLSGIVFPNYPDDLRTLTPAMRMMWMMSPKGKNEMQAVDTLSELSSRCPSSSKFVTPQCKKDQVLSNKSLQLDAMG